jgi:hypothetical protein
MIRFGDFTKLRRSGPACRARAIAVAAALAVSAEASAAAASAAVTGATFEVRLVAGDGVAAWQAEAIARTLALDLAGDRAADGSARAGAGNRLRAAPRAGFALRCPPGDLPCAMAALRSAGVDIAVRGELGATELRYEILLTWPGASPPVRHGSIDLRGRDRAALADALRAALHPVTRPGGALDDRDTQARVARPAVLAAPAASGAALVALGAALLLVLPLAIGALALGRRRLGQLARTRSLRRTLLALVGLAAIIYGLDAASDHVREWSWAIFLAGGLAWGGFAAATLPVVLPPVRGLGRVEHAELVRVVRAWSLLALRRAVQVALFYAPFAVALWGACAALELAAPVALGVVAPFWGLCARLSLRSLVEVLSLRLDADLIDGEESARDDWHAAVRGYFMGYVRRAGWPVDERILRGARFLPGRGEEVFLYGGGLAHPRVVVGRELLELALAPPGRPHDYAQPRVSKLHWTEWNAGLVVPIRRDLPVATPEERQPSQTTVEGEVEHLPLGEPRTLAGIVEPSAIDRRSAHRPWEDPLWLAWDPGDEHDGTDAGDKDFLFGLLVHELGRVERHEDRASTLAVAWRRWIEARPRWLRRAAAVALAPLRLVWGRRPSPIGDAHAALNFARHHLIQHLGFLLWRRHDFLTARAFAPELERRSGEILRALEDPPVQTAPLPSAAVLRRRLAWMAGFVRHPHEDGGGRRWRRRAAIAGAALAVLVALALAVAQSIDYHATYLERMNERPPDHDQGQ